MLLCYRGSTYSYRSHHSRTVPGQVIGKYRGAILRSHQSNTPLPQPIRILTYRGVTYITGMSQTVEPPESEAVLV